MGYRNEQDKKEQQRLYYLANKDRLREKRIANKDALNEKFRAYYRDNRELMLQRNHTYRLANRDKVSAQRLANKDRLNAKSREYYQLNRERLIAKGRERHHLRKSGVREWRLKRKYGLTADGWTALFLSQNKCCAICKTTCARAWDVDHCHASGRVRGILCHHCNVMIGMAKDSAGVLTAAIEYLNASIISDTREAA